MLINHDKQIVIFTPAKNYSHSIITYFGNQGWITRYGTNPHIRGDIFESDPTYYQPYWHSNVVSKDIETYTKLLVIRNPYDRVLSFWSHFNNDLTFNEWFLKYSKFPVCFPVTRLYKYDHLIKCESIEDDFSKHELSVNLEKLNSHTKEHQLTDIEKEQIYYLHYEDFINGKYSK